MTKLLTTQYRVIATTCMVYTLMFNVPFFTRFYAVNQQSITMVFSGFILLWAIHFLFFSLLAGRGMTKGFLVLGFLAGAASSYFSYTYGVVVDTDMLRNVMQTDAAEAGDLLNATLVAAMLLGGLVPSAIILRLKIPLQPLKKELLSKLVAVGISVAIVFGTVLAFSASYATFLREHKSVRYFTEPITPIYSLMKLSVDKAAAQLREPIKLSRTIFDDKTQEQSEDGSELIVMIVGETVRADHLGLNGYERQTTPRLAKMDNLVSFTNFTSCGTATAVSVPCMFSPLDRKNFSDDAIYSTENILDVLARHGVSVLWRDNNSSSKGVADRVEYQSFRDAEFNTVCDTECRDEGMLVGLDDYIASHPNKDIFIVLHAMGSHGPEYYKRYPQEFDQYQPNCETNNLSQCSKEALRNSYDNSILYADSFIADSIDLLKAYKDHETALIYVSDHGESLGENNIYLHGLPYSFAPMAQKHVAALAWIPPNSDFDFVETSAQIGAEYSHDDLFCSLLAAFEVTARFCEESTPFLILKNET